MGEVLKPPFTYFGGKTAIAERIVALLPAHEHYVEPFAGSLAVLLAKPPAKMETVNDLDGALVTFWRVLRDRGGDLERICSLTPHSRAEYEAAYADSDDELEQARRVWVRIVQGRRGTLSNVGWRFNVSAAGTSWSTVEYQDSYLRRMAAASARLRRVSLECRPALEVIAAYGRHPDALVYADPPYLAETRGVHGPGYAMENCGEPEHRGLLEALLSCRAAVVLSGYASELYDGLYHVVPPGDRHPDGQRRDRPRPYRGFVVQPPVPGDAVRPGGIVTVPAKGSEMVTCRLCPGG